MSDGTNGDTASKLQSILTAIKNEGFTDIGALVAKLHDTAAELGRAETARDKFAAANVDASKIIGSKGAEHGEMLKQLEEVKGERDALQIKLDATGTEEPKPAASNAAPKQSDPPPAKPVAEQLAELEAGLTEEQWGVAGQLLALVEDKDEAIALDEDPAKRLKFLSDLASNTEIKEKPTAFTRKPASNETPAAKGETQVELLLKQLTGVTHGPSGRSVATGGQGQGTKPQTDPRLS